MNTRLAFRNVFVRDGRILIILFYNKARASNYYAFYIVRYLPSSLGMSVFKYLVYIRRFLDFLAGQLQMPRYQSTEFLFPNPGLKKKHHPLLGTTNPLAPHKRSPKPMDPITLPASFLAIAKRYIKDLITKIDFYNPLDTSHLLEG